jgi:hypothetical protein
MRNLDPTPEELAKEAREALRGEPPESADEHFARLVRLGWINAGGQVTKLIGGLAEPEPNYETWTANEDGPARKSRAQGRKRIRHGKAGTP